MDMGLRWSGLELSGEPLTRADPAPSTAQMVGSFTIINSFTCSDFGVVDLR